MVKIKNIGFTSILFAMLLFMLLKNYYLLQQTRQIWVSNNLQAETRKLFTIAENPDWQEQLQGGTSALYWIMSEAEYHLSGEQLYTVMRIYCPDFVNLQIPIRTGSNFESDTYNEVLVGADVQLEEAGGVQFLDYDGKKLYKVRGIMGLGDASFLDDMILINVRAEDFGPDETLSLNSHDPSVSNLLTGRRTDVVTHLAFLNFYTFKRYLNFIGISLIFCGTALWSSCYFLRERKRMLIYHILGLDLRNIYLLMLKNICLPFACLISAACCLAYLGLLAVNDLYLIGAAGIEAGALFSYLYLRKFVSARKCES